MSDYFEWLFIFRGVKDNVEWQGDTAVIVYNRCFSQFAHPYSVMCTKPISSFFSSNSLDNDRDVFKPTLTAKWKIRNDTKKNRINGHHA